jgi:hypothetical protein
MHELSFWEDDVIRSLRLRLRSGLRQQGSAFGAVVYGPTEVGPFLLPGKVGWVGRLLGKSVAAAAPSFRPAAARKRLWRGGCGPTEVGPFRLPGGGGVGWAVVGANRSLRLRLRSGLRERGGAFGAVVYGPTEVGPFRLPGGGGVGWAVVGQFSRCGCAFAPACGSEEAPLARRFMAQLKLDPSDCRGLGGVGWVIGCGRWFLRYASCAWA